MDGLFILALADIGLLIISWLGYSTMTDKVIREQEWEIKKLKIELRRSQRKNVSSVVKIQKLNSSKTRTEEADDLFGEW